MQPFDPKDQPQAGWNMGNRNRVITHPESQFWAPIPMKKLIPAAVLMKEFAELIHPEHSKAD